MMTVQMENPYITLAASTRDMIFNNYQYAQVLSLLLAIACHRGLYRYRLMAFVPLLIIVNSIEFTGANYKLLGWIPWMNNHAIFNLNLLLETPLRFFIIGQMLQLRHREARVFYLVCILLMLAIVYNYTSFQGMVLFNSFSVILIEVATIVGACLVLTRRVLNDDSGPSLWSDPYFWISAGMLLFALLTLAILGLQPYIFFRHVSLWGRSLYKVMMPVPNFILYFSYCYAFILCITNKARS